MYLDKGWIKLHRLLKDKVIWQKSTPEQKVILITLLLMVNHKENEWEWGGKKFKVMPGQMVTSLENIQRECGKGISVQNVRTALKKFQKYEFLTNKSTKTGRFITIVNWQNYQDTETETNKDTNREVTKSQQRGNKEVTPNKNDKNDKNVYKNIVEYLNQKTNKNFKYSTKATQRLIDARINEKFTVDDFKKVIDAKCSQWFGGEMEQYLRPQTLFGTKFESYLNEKKVKKESSKVADFKKLTKFHNFQQRTDSFSENDLERLARMKRAKVN